MPPELGNCERMFRSVCLCDPRCDETDLPCDPRGGMLMETPDPEAFLAAAEENSEAYGEHGLDAFIAAHNDNCVVSPTDHRNTCLRTWAEYNALLATKRNAKATE